MTEEVWIGLAQLSQRPGTGVLMDCNLAYATVLGLADSADTFKRVVGGAADRMGFDLLELEEEEPLRIRQIRCEVPAPALRLAAKVSDTGEVRFSPYLDLGVELAAAYRPATLVARRSSAQFVVLRSIPLPTPNRLV